MTTYNLVYDSEGTLVAINTDIDGFKTPLPFDFRIKKFDEDNPLTIALRAWEAENGELDLSDRQPDPVEIKPEYRLNYLLSSDRTLTPLGNSRFPEDINYNTEPVIGLTTETIDYFGLRIAQVFYQSLDINTLEKLEAPIPIVFERYEYNWDSNLKVPTGRLKKIYFYDTDGNLSDRFKVLPKEFYSDSDRNNIVYYRRQEIVNWLIARASKLKLGDTVKSFFGLYKSETDKYILFGDKTILAIVKDATDPWLDKETDTPLGTVRNSILISFTKALEATPNKEIEAFLSKKT